MWESSLGKNVSKTQVSILGFKMLTPLKPFTITNASTDYKVKIWFSKSTVKSEFNDVLSYFWFITPPIWLWSFTVYSIVSYNYSLFTLKGWTCNKYVFFFLVQSSIRMISPSLSSVSVNNYKSRGPAHLIKKSIHYFSRLFTWFFTFTKTHYKGNSKCFAWRHQTSLFLVCLMSKHLKHCRWSYTVQHLWYCKK